MTSSLQVWGQTPDYLIEDVAQPSVGYISSVSQLCMLPIRYLLLPTVDKLMLNLGVRQLCTRQQ